MTPRFGPDFTPSTVMYFCPASSPRALSSPSTSPSISKTFSILRAQHLPTWNASGSGRASENSSLGTVLACIPHTPTRQPLDTPLCFRSRLRNFTTRLAPQLRKSSPNPSPSLHSSLRSLRRHLPCLLRPRLRPRARTTSPNLSPSPFRSLRRLLCSLHPHLHFRVLLTLCLDPNPHPRLHPRLLRLFLSRPCMRPRALKLSQSPSLHPHMCPYLSSPRHHLPSSYLRTFHLPLRFRIPPRTYSIRSPLHDR